MEQPDPLDQDPVWDDPATENRRLRRLTLAWANLLEILRAGRLSEPFGSDYEVVAATTFHALRHYTRHGAETEPRPAVLLVPPLMVTAEIYDLSRDTSAVRALLALGIDVWVVDFGSPEATQEGLSRTLDDHVRAVAEAVAEVGHRTGREVHLAGYSQGGIFCYQAAALRRNQGIASIITFGSPVDWHRTLPGLNKELSDRVVAGMHALIERPLARINRLPAFVTANAFKLVSARKEAVQFLDFVRKLHDREALKQREARRLFLGGEGFTAWPGPALRKFVEELIVANRLHAGGLVIDGHVITLADVTCPVLYFIGTRDEIARPATVRAIVEASPRARAIYEADVATGHFGLVVGSSAQSHTWPRVAAWMQHVENQAPLPAGLRDPREAAESRRRKAAAGPRPAPLDGERLSSEFAALRLDLAALRSAAKRTLQAGGERFLAIGGDFGAYVDDVRWQLPRLRQLRALSEDTRISLGQLLDERAAKLGDQTLFLWGGRAFSYRQANARVDAIAQALLARGCQRGDVIGVWMRSRPTLLALTAALSRIGAVVALLPPTLDAARLAEATAQLGLTVLCTDPERAEDAAELACDAATSLRVFVLGGVGAHSEASLRAELPAEVFDLETIAPELLRYPPGFVANPAVARELAMIFVHDDAGMPLRYARVSHLRWAYSAIGAASACKLTARDTVYCCLPLHHPTGLLVAVSSTLFGGSRLALATNFTPAQLVADARRFGVSVVFYAGDMCRALIHELGADELERLPIRIFAGSGMRKDVWRAMQRRSAAAIVEFYAASEAPLILVNASGEKVGALGQPLPGSADVALAAWDFLRDDFLRDGHGQLVAAVANQPGVLMAAVARTDEVIAAAPSGRYLLDAFAFGDAWYVTQDFAWRDHDGDYHYLGPASQWLLSTRGPVFAGALEDAAYELAGVERVVATARDGKFVVVATSRGSKLDREAWLAKLQAHLAFRFAGVPMQVHHADKLALTTGFRALMPVVTGSLPPDAPIEATGLAQTALPDAAGGNA